MTIGPEYVARLREALTSFYEDVGRVIQKHENQPSPGSIALIEHFSHPRSESIVSAWSIGGLLIEYGRDHLTAFVKLITEPVEAIASWTCVRSMLESCAVAAWVLDPDIDAQHRVSRVFAIRSEGMEQQLTFMRASGYPASEILSAEQQLDDMEKDALSLGFKPVVNRKGERIGIGEQMPGPTAIIETSLGEAKMYRILSAVAHGHHWAIRELGFTHAGTGLDVSGTTVQFFEKSASIQGFALLGYSVMKALARPLWNECRYFGWNTLELEEVFEDVADKLDVKTERRFWRS